MSRRIRDVQHRMSTHGKNVALPEDVRADCRMAERVIVELVRERRTLIDRLDELIAQANWRQAEARLDERASNTHA